MKQDIYDDPIFFEGYRNLRRTESGLNAAIEDPAVASVLPDLGGLEILDLGSGFGDFCRWARKNGAAKVVGVELSERMITEAGQRTSDPRISYVQAAMEDFSIGPKAYDVIVSRMALHYVSDYRGMVGSIYRGLRGGGVFVFSVEHPICTALCRGWHEDAEGKPLFWPVDDYGREGERRHHWFVAGVIKYHRTVETYVNTLLDAGFGLARLLEPQVSGRWRERRPDLMDSARRPPVLVVAAKKPAGPVPGSPAT